MDVHVAVASNFSGAMQELAEAFEAESGADVVLSFGSTGKHYAQIVNGAPYDAFFAADAERPKLLEREEKCVPGSRFTYALGQLALWSADAARVNADGNGAELAGEFRHLAIANPKLAPYGRAARETLEAMGLWAGVQGRLVMGENIAQTFQFVVAGNAELGFVAYSQIAAGDYADRGSWWIVPPELYMPIEQQAVLLKDSEEAKAFLLFARSQTARDIILRHGYDIP